MKLCIGTHNERKDEILGVLKAMDIAALEVEYIDKSNGMYLVKDDGSRVIGFESIIRLAGVTGETSVDDLNEIPTYIIHFSNLAKLTLLSHFSVNYNKNYFYDNLSLDDCIKFALEDCAKIEPKLVERFKAYLEKTAKIKRKSKFELFSI